MRLLLGFGVAALASGAPAASLYAPGAWSSLATDQRASQLGDVLTILIYQDASATNSADSGTRKSRELSGRAQADGVGSQGAGLALGSSFGGSGRTARSGRMVAQITTTVDNVLPNGDLHVAGVQQLNINGEKTRIAVRGRVRRADIIDGNAVLSTRLADAEIDYDGSGFVSRNARPGLFTRLFDWLGLL